MKAVYVQRGESIDYTPLADTAAGEVIIANSLVGITKLPILANTLGSVATTGIYEVVKTLEEVEAADKANVFSSGAIVYWDAANANATSLASVTVAGVEEAPDVITDFVRIGIAIDGASATDTKVRVLLNA